MSFSIETKNLNLTSEGVKTREKYGVDLIK